MQSTLCLVPRLIPVRLALVAVVVRAALLGLLLLHVGIFPDELLVALR